MRWLVAILAGALSCAFPAQADDVRLNWPLRPRPAVVRTFDAPSPDWHRGHRGVDLAGTAGQPVYAAGAGTVVYAGTLAGRQVVSLAHPGGLHTSYEPVQVSVRVGQQLTAGAVIGELLAGHPGCPVAA
ncbi:MAG: peptidoglycan DD-metalloendopeptidase family protein, partial [Mycobacterium sp.]|nr:peptidoglycan DD-metalloendopeptidase family protein [Mycobacterium sp.]